MLELVSLEKKANKLREVQIMPLDNSNSWNHYFFTMVAKLTDETLTWFCTHSIRTSYTYSPSSISDSTLHFQASHSTSNLCIRCTISLWHPCLSCGMLVSILRKKERKDLDKALTLKWMTWIRNYILRTKYWLSWRKSKWR